MLDFRTKTPGTAGTESSNEKGTPKQAARAFSRRTSSRSSAFDNILAANSQDDDPFGPRDGMYEFQRLNQKTLTQTVEYLDTLRSKTKWDDMEDEERKIDLPIVVLVDLRADGTDVHVSPKKCSKSASASAPAPIIKRMGSVTASVVRASAARKCTNSLFSLSYSFVANFIMLKIPLILMFNAGIRYAQASRSRLQNSVGRG